MGEVTRGTTSPNRLRRFDRWLAFRGGSLLRDSTNPLVVDVGFGDSPITTLELAARLRAGCPGLRVVGIEIDPGRVLRAQRWLTGTWWTGTGLTGTGSSGTGSSGTGSSGTGSSAPLTFMCGGFELPVQGAAVMIRACNVLRQYRSDQVRPAWESMAARLVPGGILVEGTCDEIGRLASWVTMVRPASAAGIVPESLTLSADLRHLDRPSDLAARLPKVLIHDNIPGRPIHAWLAELDRQWDRAASLSVYGPRQRWMAAVAGSSVAWPVIGGARRWRLGEVTIAWHAICPRGE